MRISIITVVYNDKLNILKTIESVRKQNKDLYEFIVVDGDSTDGTKSIVESNLEVVDKYVSERDEGLYYAMNKGKNLATGEMALFMNAGDVFVNDLVIETLIGSIDDPNKLYYGNTIIYYDKVYKEAPIRHHQSVLFPREFYKNVNYNAQKYKVVAEGDFIYKALFQCDQMHVDIDIIFSKIDGFRIHRYNSINGMIMMYKEVTSLMSEHDKKVNLSYRLTYPLKSLSKYLAFKIGGLPLVAKLLLRSYKMSKNKYILN